MESLSRSEGQKKQLSEASDHQARNSLITLFPGKEGMPHLQESEAISPQGKKEEGGVDDKAVEHFKTDDNKQEGRAQHGKQHNQPIQLDQTCFSTKFQTKECDFKGRIY